MKNKRKKEKASQSAYLSADVQWPIVSLLWGSLSLTLTCFAGPWFAAAVAAVVVSLALLALSRPACTTCSGTWGCYRPITCTRCLTAYIHCLMAYTRCLMAYTRCLMAYIHCLIAYTRCLMAYTRCLMAHTRCSMAHTRGLMAYTRSLMACTCCLMACTRCLIAYRLMTYTCCLMVYIR